MKTNYSNILFYYYKIDGERIDGQANNFETMVLNYRKLLRANKKNRVQKNSLRYKFPHQIEYNK
tara:strand:- start:12289 stop:12480 length:192 start_codon:yes stop_codon:yes gene_type:complete